MIFETQEPPGCQPKTHWEERVIAMEFALQDLMIDLGAHLPSARPALIRWLEAWTKQRDELRAHHRTDKN